MQKGISAAFIWNAAGNPEQLSERERIIRAVVDAHGKTIDKVVHDLADLLRAVEGGEIATLWFDNYPRFPQGAGAVQVMKEIMAAAGMKIPKVVIISATLDVMEVVQAAKKEEFVTRMKRGKEAARRERERHVH